MAKSAKRIDYRSHEYDAPYGAGDANSRRPNSRKAYVQRLFDSEGGNNFDAAEKWGIKHGLKPSTLRTWANSWRRAMSKAKASKARKRSAKPKAKPAVVAA